MFKQRNATLFKVKANAQQIFDGKYFPHRIENTLFVLIVVTFNFFLNEF